MTAATSAKETPARPATPWGLVILLGSLTGMGPLGIDMYLASLPAISSSLHASAAQAQGTLAAFLAGMAMGQVVYGPASDRVGRRAPILVGVAIFTVASVGCALAPTPELLLLGRFVQAIGACAGGVVSRAVVRDRFNHTETARMLSLMMLIMGLAPILAPLLGSALLLVGGWRLNFWFMAAFGVVVGLTALFRMQESRTEATAIQASKENPFQSYIAVLTQRRLLGYALAGALNGATLFTYLSASPGLLMGTYGVSVGMFPWLFGLNAVGIIGGNQVNRLLLRRMTPDQVLARSSLVALAVGVALTVAAFGGFDGPFVILPLLFLLLASYGFIQGNTMAGALSVDPVRAGAISALMGTVSFAAGSLASMLGGVLHDGTPKPMAGVMVVALAGSAAFLHAMALPKRVS